MNQDYETIAESEAVLLRHHTEPEATPAEAKFDDVPLLRWEKIWIGGILLFLADCMVTGFAWYVRLAWRAARHLLHR